MGKDPRRARGELILAVLLFGTIGLFRRGMDLPSSVIALGRGLIGTLFLLLSALLRGKALDTAAIRKDEAPLDRLSRLMDYHLIETVPGEPCPRDALRVCRLLDLDPELMEIFSKNS